MSEDKDLDEALDHCFGAIDADGNGSLDSSEIIRVLSQVNEHPCVKVKKSDKEIAEDAQAIIEGLDRNNDKKISKEEFKDFFKEHLYKL